MYKHTIVLDKPCFPLSGLVNSTYSFINQRVFRVDHCPNKNDSTCTSIPAFRQHQPPKITCYVLEPNNHSYMEIITAVPPLLTTAPPLLTAAPPLLKPYPPAVLVQSSSWRRIWCGGYRSTLRSLFPHCHPPQSLASPCLQEQTSHTEITTNWKMIKASLNLSPRDHHV